MTFFEPRNRTLPLVPDAFEQVVVPVGPDRWADRMGKFCPSFNVPEHWKSLSDEKRTILDDRARRLLLSASCNRVYESSEFGWEMLAWHHVFDAILEDETFRVDKRPYEYVQKDEKGTPVVKHRIPDATMGLRPYDDYILKHGYRCTVPDCKVDHSSMQADKRLSRDSLRDMMHDGTCGLIVDGVWGEANLVFPFAVYEAKKRASSYEAAKEQVYHACTTYLAMLDDLARDPNDVSQYQTSESSKYQIFAFTSSGPYWQVFVVWNQWNQCYIETIWEGDITNGRRTFELIRIVDQIQNYAAHQHRPFVLKHLEAWHSKRQKSSEHVKSSIRALNNLGPDEPYDIYDIRIPFGASKLPKWMELKWDSRASRRDKAMLTRQRNRKLREPAQARDAESQSDNEPKRGRGRPRKYNSAAKGNGTKRGRGRPPKTTRTMARKGKKKM
ncbi:hypothetical protein F5Y10DRAFT_257328 [Nemania abortiva]|nr:hypothetical protein F5Y10DRAFT_257328 [Nemania abortiva]